MPQDKTRFFQNLMGRYGGLLQRWWIKQQALPPGPAAKRRPRHRMGIWGAMSTAKGAAAAAEQAGAEGAPGCSGCRRCDFCEEARALVYCRADSAGLCLACDRHVHAANAVCSRHPRALLCDACLSAPSSILLCSSHRREGGQHPRLLCPNCDFDALHGEADGNKAGERRAVEPYSGCPTAVEMLALLGVSVEKEKSLLQDGGGSNGWLDPGGGGGADAGSSLLLAEEEWVWETPLILSMEDIIVPTYPCHGFQAMGVPPPPKDRYAACGKHRDEILRQLRDLVKSEVCVSSDFGLLEADMGSQSPQEIQLGNMISSAGNDTASVVIPDPPPKVLSEDQIDGVPASCPEHQLEMPMEKSKVFLDGPVDTQGSVSDAGSLHLMSREDQPSLPPKCGYKLSGLDRDNVLSRYKEKREKRRFDKQIRYESRKVRADGRMRIKGRFARVNQNVES